MREHVLLVHMQAPLAPQEAMLSIIVHVALQTPLSGSQMHMASPEHSVTVEYLAEQRCSQPDAPSWHVGSAVHVALVRITHAATHLLLVAEK